MILPAFIRSSASTSQSRRLVIAVFALYALVGIFIFRDYGISWDEPFQRLQGMVSANHVIETVVPGHGIPGAPPLETFWNRDYGVAFDTPAYFLEVLFRLDPAGPGVFYLRHFLTFALFFLAAIFMYRLVRDRFNDWRLGLLAAGMFVLSPRLFGESFYNNKDLVYLSAFVIATFYLFKFLEKKTHAAAAWFALASAFAIGIRITGVILPVVGGGLYLLEVICARRPRSAALKTFGIFCLSLIGFTILLWPYLWSAPVAHFREAFTNMAHFRLDTTVLYFGELAKSLELPWHYIPAWMMITIPVTYLVMFIVGLFFSVKQIIISLRQRTFGSALRFDLMALLLFFAPLLAVIVMDSVLYNGWRQMYFLYAPLVLLAVTGFFGLQTWLKRCEPVMRYVLPGIMVLSLFVSLVQIIRLHPYEHAYFNILAGDPNGRFEGDYWGLSYRQALEALTAADPSVPLPINVNTPPGRINTLFLDPPDQQRIVFTSPEQAKYILTDFTNQPCRFKDEISAWHAGRLKIMTIYRGGQPCVSPLQGNGN